VFACTFRIVRSHVVALKNTIVMTFGARLKPSGLPPKAVVAACMHKVVHLIYGILKSGTALNANWWHSLTLKMVSNLSWRPHANALCQSG
jgi:hypothetical protein